MGWRFRKVFRPLPGVRINVGTKNISGSVGVKGVRFTAGSSGKRLTTSLPGSGLSYTHQLSGPPPRRRWVAWVCTAVMLFFLLMWMWRFTVPWVVTVSSVATGN